MNRKHLMGIVAIVLVVVLWGLSKMVSNPAQRSGQTEVSSGDKWKVSEDHSPIDDSKTLTLSLDADNLVSGAVKTERPSLQIRCKVDKGEYRTWAYVWTGMAADPATYFSDTLDDPKIRVRLDDGEAYGAWWSQSSAHDALFPSEGGMAFAKELAKAKTLLFEFTPFQANPVVARFDLRGLDNRLNAIAEACHWHVDENGRRF